MKKILIIFVLTFGLYSNALGAGIPVIDTSAISQQASNFAKELVEMANQLNQLKQQYEQQIKQFQALTDVRGMANALNSMYDNLMKVSPEEVLSEYGIKSPTELGLGDSSSFEQTSRLAGEYLAGVRKFQEQTIKRFDELQKLIAKVNTLKDPKDALDLQARIQAEQAFLQNEAIKQELAYQQMQAERYMQEEKEQQAYIEFVKTRSNFSF